MWSSTGLTIDLDNLMSSPKSKPGTTATSAPSMNQLASSGAGVNMPAMGGSATSTGMAGPNYNINTSMLSSPVVPAGVGMGMQPGGMRMQPGGVGMQPGGMRMQAGGMGMQPGGMGAGQMGMMSQPGFGSGMNYGAPGGMGYGGGMGMRPGFGGPPAMMGAGGYGTNMPMGMQQQQRPF